MLGGLDIIGECFIGYRRRRSSRWPALCSRRSRCSENRSGRQCFALTSVACCVRRGHGARTGRLQVGAAELHRQVVRWPVSRIRSMQVAHDIFPEPESVVSENIFSPTCAARLSWLAGEEGMAGVVTDDDVELPPP